jgi:hypothetical protein
MHEKLESYISCLEGLSLTELLVEWQTRFQESAPAWRSAEYLRLTIAYRLQEQAFGGLSPDTKQKLRQFARAFKRSPNHQLTPNLDLKPGTLLEREWGGVRHRVRVLDDGFEYSDERFASLSEIARKITGSRWSGPLFFGLKK